LRAIALLRCPSAIVSSANWAGVAWAASSPPATKKLGRDVAIKVLAVGTGDEETLRRFEQEARAAALLEHPNIVAVYDIGQHENRPYIVSELLRGETLRDRMAGSLCAWKTLSTTQPSSQWELTAAHEKGVIHRDLKPENLFIHRDGRLKILDFGIAKLVTQPGRPTLTKSGTIMGTVGLHGARAGARRGHRCAIGHLRLRLGAARDALGHAAVCPRIHDGDPAQPILNDAPFGFARSGAGQGLGHRAAVSAEANARIDTNRRKNSPQTWRESLPGQTAPKSPLLPRPRVILLLAGSALTAALLGLAWQLLPIGSHCCSALSRWQYARKRSPGFSSRVRSHGPKRAGRVR